MPMRTAHANVFRDWDAILGACTENASLLPGVDPLKAELEALQAQAKELKIQQETLEGQRLGVSQRLDKTIEDGREAARKIKAFAVIRLGSANKSLAQFGVKARGPLGPRKAKTPETPPPAENPQTSQQHSPTVSTQGKEGSHA